MANPYSERTISLRVAKKYITNGYAVHMIDDEFALTERVTDKKTGGHSAGSCIVVADNFGGKCRR